MVTQFTGGITNDFDPKVKEFISYCRGTIDQSTNGDVLSKSSVPGNSLVKEYAGYSLLGQVNGEDEVYLFLKGENDIILGVNKTTVVEYMVEDLSFNNPIRATFRVKNGCERIIYFVDGENPDRRINLDRLFDYYIDGVLSIDKLNLAVTTESISIANITKTDLDGSLDVGTVSFIVEALNNDLDVIYKTSESLSIPVFNKTKGYSDVETTGAYNIDSADVGIGGIPKVSGAIEVEVDDFPEVFKYLRLIAIRKISGDGLQRDAVRVGKLFTSKKLIYKGLTQEDELIDVSEALIPFTIYDTSKEIEQVHNRLVRGNLTESVYDWGKFQPFASKIGAKFVVGDHTTEKDPSTYINGEGFMPDEVVPFGIKYRLKSGRTSPVFPIIGQCMNSGVEGDEVDVIVTDGTTEIGSTTIRATIRAIADSDGSDTNVDYTFNFLLNGVPTSHTFNFFFNRDEEDPQDTSSGGPSQLKIYIKTFNGIITDLTTDYVISEHTDFEIVVGPLYSLEVNTFLTDGYNQDLPLAPLDGWDDTVYPTWNEDMSWYISKEDYISGAGSFYGKTDVESLEALKLKLALPRRYEIYNTAYQTSTTEGRLGYYQNRNFKYEQQDCEDDYWGLDICGNPVLGSPIRHFRMPDRRLIPNGKLGIKFFNIEYPHEDVIGHEFVVAKLDEPFVLDQGVASRMRGRDDQGRQEYGFSYIEAQGDSKDRGLWNAVFTPKTLQKEYQAALYLKNLTLLSAKSWFAGINDGDTGTDNAETDWNYVCKAAEYREQNPEYVSVPSQINLKINKNRFLDRLRYDPVGTDTLINVSVANSINAIETDRILTMPSTRGLSKISLNTYRDDAYSNPLNLEYEKLHSKYLRLNEEKEIYKGNIFHSEFLLNNYMLVSREGSFFRSIFGNGNSLYAELASIFANVAKYESFFYKNGFEEYSPFSGFPGSQGEYEGKGSSEFHSEHLNGIFVDSTYNYKLNHSGENSQFKSMQLPFDGQTLFNNGSFPTYTGDEGGLPSYWEGVKAYLNLKLTSYDETNNKTYVRSNPYGEPYNYNKDYNYANLSPQYSLGFNYDFCSNCLNNFPNRYVFSPVSNLEESQDLYRVTLANDFRDMTSNTGEITGLNLKADRLIINTKYSSFVKPINPQTLQTNENNVYVGTGEFLSLPEVQFRETNTSYGGKQFPYAHSSNEFGLQWVDTINGQIFNYTGSNLEVLSDKEWLHWFKLNLPIEGEGKVHLNFDPYFKRLILTKNDILPSGEDKSFTFCYSFLKQKWDSFQPYISELGFNNVNRMYSFNEGIYLHETNKNFNIFYGKKYPMIIETSVPLVQTQFLSTVEYIADFEILDGTRWEPIEDNFNNIWVYNDFQSTGKQDINTINQVTNPFGNIAYNNSDISCIKTDNNFKLAQLWDISGNNNIYSNSWEDIQDEYPIDKVPTNIVDKNQFQLSKIKGKYVKVRLYFESEEDVKATLHYLNINNKLSVR